MYEYFDLTERLPFKIDLEGLLEDLVKLEGEGWLSHYDTDLADGWTTIPLVSHDGGCDGVDAQRLGTWGSYKRTKYVEKLPAFKALLDAFECPQGRVRIMKLMPGSVIRPHRDTFDEVSDIAFGQVRLHIPLITNEKVRFYVSGRNYHLAAGKLHYINFSKVHHVVNDGDSPRVHLVLDLKVNEFLESIFPPKMMYQKVECYVTRILFPVFVWWPIKLKTNLNTLFWYLYNDSLAQRFKKKFLG